MNEAELKQTLSKEKNFVSAVVYLRPGRENAEGALGFFGKLAAELEAHFAQYEIVAVDDAAPAGVVAALRSWAADCPKPLTILHMGLRQGLEAGMNAGLDAAIGDYVYEFDSTEMPYDPALIFRAYETAQKGNDIVSVCPTRTRGSSVLFYKIFNANSHGAGRLRTDAFRLVSRRAINRVHASSPHLPYRKAAYAASGLAMADLEFDGRLTDREAGRFRLAVDSLALYTDAGYRLSAGVAVAMMLVALAELAYTLLVFATGHPIQGWTTTMFVLTLGFAGVFAVLAIVVKYLSLLVDLVFKRQKYLIEGIEKIQK